MSWTRDTTADEILAGVDLSGRTAVVTGASAGLGRDDGFAPSVYFELGYVGPAERGAVFAAFAAWWGRASECADPAALRSGGA